MAVSALRHADFVPGFGRSIISPFPPADGRWGALTLIGDQDGVPLIGDPLPA